MVTGAGALNGACDDPLETEGDWGAAPPNRMRTLGWGDAMETVLNPRSLAAALGFGDLLPPAKRFQKNRLSVMVRVRMTI